MLGFEESRETGERWRGRRWAYMRVAIALNDAFCISFADESQNAPSTDEDVPDPYRF